MVQPVPEQGFMVASTTACAGVIRLISYCDLSITQVVSLLSHADFTTT